MLALAGTTDATPVDKVITLLTKLSAQVQAEGAAEAASYDKYACFCKEQASDKLYTIDKSDKKIKELEAAIEELEGEIKALDEAVADNRKEVEKEEKTQADNKKVREEESSKYVEKRKNLEEAVDAVSGALSTMRRSRDDVDQAVAGLLQKVSTESPYLALIAGATGGSKYHAPDGKAKSYEYGSKEVIATLTSLQTTFKKELADLDKEEINAASDYNMARGARANTIAALQKEINEKETLSASKSEEKSNKETDKQEETDARDSDQGFLDDVTKKCEAKAAAWDKRSSTRASELTALGQAVELLKGMGNAYSANSKLVGLISKNSKHSAASFLQLRSARRQTLDGVKLQKLTDQLKKQAHSMNSASLAMLALRLQAAGPDHFVKVRGLIKDLITKLEEDAAAEADAKSLCDKNMKAAVEKRDKNAADMETASAQIESTSASINDLKKEVADLAANIADLNKEKLMATELRNNEKAENLKTISNAESGKTAVDSAIEILKKFYESLLQTKASPVDRSGNAVKDLAPETFSSDEEYKGKGDSSKGIIGMLEVISSDFERTVKTVSDAEDQAKKDYEALTSDIKKAVKEKETLKEKKKGEVESKNSDLTGFKSDHKDASKMNAEAIEELEKLQASCVDTGESYAERAKHRKEEIEALKQALQLLEDWKD